jgi:hypothetical protein
VVEVEGTLIPSSIQRIRSFLVEMCGMKVKPWAGTEETLAALHATLVARQGCDIFWASLRVLLETLARDLKSRQDAAPSTLVDNEVLDAERYTTLIDEIRAALAGQAAGTPASTFRRLAASLSTPALGLLLFLGGATTIGCAREPLQSRSQDASADLADARTSQPDTKADSSIYIQLPETRPAPDAAPTKYAATSGPDGGTVTIQDIMNSCNIPIDQQGTVLACLAALDSSWRAGIASALAGQDCMAVDSALDCGSGKVCGGQLSGAFNPANPRICQSILIYLGVRFV